MQLLCVLINEGKTSPKTMLKKILSIQFHDQQINIGILILRVSLAGLMIPHGYNLLIHFTEKQDSFTTFMGLSSSISLTLAIGAELFCSIFLLIGLGTRLILIPLMITMSVAIIHAHNGDIFGDGQTAFLYLIGFLTVFIIGAGKYSVDNFFTPKEKEIVIPAAEIKNKREDRSANFEVGGEG